MIPSVFWPTTLQAATHAPRRPRQRASRSPRSNTWASWPSDRVLRAAIWIVPAIALALAATNEQHHVYWRAITEVATPLGSRLVYTGGPRYWVHASIHSTNAPNDATRGQSAPW